MSQSKLTFDQAMADQADLDQLCRTRELNTPEIFSPNDYYGMASILKLYSSIPLARPLKLVIPHGVRPDDHLIWEAEVAAPLPAVFCYLLYRCNAYEEATDKVVIRAASPFLYGMELLKDEPLPERKGTIFFPSHSTHHITVDMDYPALADRLHALPAEFQPVTVCIYWRDYQLGRHWLFQQRGHKVVSAGHMYDRNFLFRLYYLLASHRYAAGSSLGSHLFYSVMAGCSYFLVKSDHRLVAAPAILDRDVPGPTSARASQLAQLEELFSIPQSSVTPEQAKVVDYYLGTEYLKSPEELREQLEYAEWLDKWGFRRHNASGHVFRVPTFYTRNAQRAANKVKSLVKMRRGQATNGQGS